MLKARFLIEKRRFLLPSRYRSGRAEPLREVEGRSTPDNLLQAVRNGRGSELIVGNSGHIAGQSGQIISIYADAIPDQEGSIPGSRPSFPNAGSAIPGKTSFGIFVP
jgi:hypothetical protein